MCGGFPSGIVQNSIFLTRNAGKTLSGKDTGRIGATVGQAVTLTDSVANTSIFGEKVSGVASNILDFADNKILDAADKIGHADDLAGLAAKTGTKSTVGAIARKAVNPLLCVAAGIRVLKDDDPYAALIEESSAMGAMFAMEKGMKTARNSFYDLAGSADDIIAAAKNSDGIKKIFATAAEKFKGMSKGKQTAAKIGLELLFVAGSIGAYAIGKKIGQTLSHRKESQAQA